MARFVAFLRAVNVGGTGKLPMSDLRQMCERLGFEDVRTYIASGNVLLTSKLSKGSVRKRLEDALAEYARRDVGVTIRTPAELRKILRRNPFADEDPKKTLTIFLNRRPPQDALAQAVGRVDERLELGEREIYVFFPDGMGSSKLRIPATAEGTARNVNTIRKMIDLASE